MKKYVAILTAFIMLLSFSSPVFAADDFEDLVFELSALGIVSPQIGAEVAVTRGEFAQMATALLGLSEAAEGMSPFTEFEDVSASNPYACDINLLSKFSIMNGMGEGMFSPDSLLLSEQAVKVITVCVGYEPIAEQNGGWSSGYISAATKHGLLKGVNLTNPISRRDVYKILSNALDINLVENIFDKKGMTYKKTGSTLRQILMNDKENRIYHLSGVVQANSYSYISSPIEKLCDDEVVIDDVIYKIGASDAGKLIGHYVNFYASEENGVYTILSVQKDKFEKVINIKSEEVLSKNDATLHYTDERNNNKSATITDMTKVIYNGTRVKYPSDDIFNIKEGNLTLIDHDNDKIIDVVFVEEYVSLMAYSYSEGLINLWDETRYNGKNHLYVNPEDREVKMIVMDSKGNMVESFDSDKVVSVFANQAGSRVKVVVSDASVEGAVTTIDEDGVTIGEDFYYTDKSCPLDIEMGVESSFYLNFEGKLAFIKKVSNENYGYILQIAREGSFGGMQARILEAGNVDFGVNINEEDVNDTNQVPFLIAQNKAVCVVSFAEKVKVNGQRYDASGLQDVLSGIGPVKYELNDDGKISKIESMVKCGGDLSRRSKYNVYEMVFGGSELFEGFAINKDTKVICVPTEEASDEDYMVKVNITVENNEVGYLVSGYDYDTQTKKAKVLLIFADMNADLVRSVDIFSNKASLVKSVKHMLNEETGDYDRIYEFVSGTETVSLKSMDRTSGNAALDTLSFADLVCFEENNNGQLENAVKIRSIAALNNDVRRTSADGYTETFGSVVSREFDEVDSLNYVIVTELTVLSDGVQYTFRIPQRNKPPVYIYNKEVKTVESGDLKDIIPGNDKVYILERSGSNQIRAVVLVR